jgi:hypothetical protein
MCCDRWSKGRSRLDFELKLVFACFIGSKLTALLAKDGGVVRIGFTQRTTHMLSHSRATMNIARGPNRRRNCVLSGVLLALLTTTSVSYAAEGEQDAEQLIARAEQAIAANRLTTPAADNAVAYIERALALNPNDSRAAALLEQVVARYQRLVNTALDQGEQAKLRSLERAITLRDRASAVIAKHGLSSTAIAGMDESIAAMGKPASSQASLAGGTTDEMLKQLVDQHMALASAFLAKENPQEAGWHAAQAEALAGRYHLAVGGLANLKQQVAVAEESGQVATAKASPTAAELTDVTREDLTELAAFHVSSENAAMAQGDVSAAVSHRRAADDLVAKYGLSEEEVRNASTQLGQVQPVRPTIISRRVFGTF